MAANRLSQRQVDDVIPSPPNQHSSVGTMNLFLSCRVMAASTSSRTIVICGDSDRSSEDDESVKRLKGATAVEFLHHDCGDDDDPVASAADVRTHEDKKRSGNEQAAAQSLQRTKSRICFQDDDQGSSALQTTPEFRSHVAKKLGEALDRLIKISGAAITPLSCEHSPQESGDGDDSFRLFSSSVPGCHPASPVAPKRRRQISVPSSDEDSDAIEHQHLVESAVSGEEIIQNGALHMLYKPRASPSLTVKRIHDKNKNKMSKESTTTIKSSAAAKQIMLDRHSRRIDLGGGEVKNVAKLKLECEINAVSKNKGFQDGLSKRQLLNDKIIISKDSKYISEGQSDRFLKKKKTTKQKFDQK